MSTVYKTHASRSKGDKPGPSSTIYVTHRMDSEEGDDKFNF